MFYSAQKKSHKEFLSWREKKKAGFSSEEKKVKKNEKVKHLIQMGKIGNISAISVLTQFEFVYFCFCFEFTIFWNLFSEHVFYVSVRLVRREQFVRAENQSLCHSFFLLLLLVLDFMFIWPIWRAANRTGEELCSPRTLSLSIEFLWTFQAELQNLFQMSTVNS